MKRPPILRLSNGAPRYRVTMNPASKGGVSTCTVHDHLTGSIAQGPFTDMKECVFWCDRLSAGEDMTPHFAAIQASVEQTQLWLEV